MYLISLILEMRKLKNKIFSGWSRFTKFLYSQVGVDTQVMSHNVQWLRGCEKFDDSLPLRKMPTLALKTKCPLCPSTSPHLLLLLATFYFAHLSCWLSTALGEARNVLFDPPWEGQCLVITSILIWWLISLSGFPSLCCFQIFHRRVFSDNYKNEQTKTLKKNEETAHRKGNCPGFPFQLESYLVTPRAKGSNSGSCNSLTQHSPETENIAKHSSFFNGQTQCILSYWILYLLALHRIRI